MIELGQIEVIALETMDNIHKNSDKKWNSDCKFIDYRKNLENNDRGKFGKKFVITMLQILEKGQCFESNNKKEEWDFQFNNKKYKVKTASSDKNNKFQNERLKENVSLDGVIFVGVAPDQLYIKCVKYDKTLFEKSHDRSKAKTGAGHKLDYKINDMIPIKNISDFWNIFEKTFI